MMAAAASFSSLSSELGTNATAYESVISQLTGWGLDRARRRPQWPPRLSRASSG